LDSRLRARLAQSSRWAKDKSHPARFQKGARPTGPPDVAVARDNVASSGIESPLEEREPKIQAGEPVESSSESDEGNE